MFQKRSAKLERIDTGDYTSAEYELFLREISFINRYLGDEKALKNSLLRTITIRNPREFSVLDVGAGSGQMLRSIADFARKTKRRAQLAGLDLNELSAKTVLEKSKNFSEIRSVRGDALLLPFAGNSFDYAICSLFTHHFSDASIVEIIKEMQRVSRREIFVIDLQRHPLAYLSYKIFCAAFRISPLVRHDGSLSILRSFKPSELKNLAEKADLKNARVERHFPFRLVLRGG
jgi:ubiquinone/menaquinone biosynthesis C-methylase UbiE